MRQPLRSWLRSPRVKLGLDVLLESKRHLLHGRRVGIIAGPTSLTWDLQHMADLFAQADDVNLVALFGPEHGVWGAAQAGTPVESERDGRTGLPVYSLYGERQKPTPEMVRDLDALVFSIQDVGARFYTYGSTMALCMQTAAEQHLEFFVLDRPNPITGTRIEGCVLDPSFGSFVGLYPIPVRHGLTLGELARMVNREFGVGCDLTVVPMEGWKRSMWWEDTGLPFVLPSPNIPTVDTAAIYPGTCFFEGTNLAFGLGTTRTFELIGAPWIGGQAWAAALNALDYPGVLFRATWFTPWYGVHRGRMCRGVQLHVLDREIYLAVQTGLKMIEVVRQMYPDDFAWRRSGDGHSGSTRVRYWFDQLMGTDKVRREMELGVPVEAIVASWQPELESYDTMRNQYLLY